MPSAILLEKSSRKALAIILKSEIMAPIRSHLIVIELGPIPIQSDKFGPSF